jgi:hypothetical protein
MAAGEELAARARAALDLVSRDTLARDRFTRAYTGTGGALRSLRAAADPAVSQVAGERRDALRRIAFGRTLTAAEEDAARAARQALHDEERLRALDADALDRAIRALGGVFGTDLTPDSSPFPDATFPDDRLAAVRPARVLRRTWMIPIVALCLAAGYGSSAFSRQWTGPAPAPPVSDSGSVTRLPAVDPRSTARSGSPIAADEWFSQPQVEDDTVDAPTLLSDLGIDPATTRFMGATVHGALLWIAKRPDRSYCVVGMRPWNGGTFGSCTSLDDFVRAGLQLTQGLDSVRWDGIKFTTLSTTSVYG